MSIIKKNEKTGEYYVRYDAGFDSKGKRKQKYKGGFKKQKDAEDFLAQVRVDLKHGTYTDPDKMFVFEYLDKWLEYQKDRLSPTTYSGYDINIRCHTNPYIGGIRLQELKALNIKDMYSKLQKPRTIEVDDEKRKFDPLSPTSIRYVHRVLSKALEDACKDEVLYRNPAKNVSIPKVTKYKAQFLSIAQIKDLLTKFEGDDLFIPVYLSVVLGLRRGEVLGLKWEHIDMKNKVVRIRENYVMAQGKPLLLENVKTQTSDRDIVITDRIVALLEAYRKKQKKLRTIITDFVCTWSDGSLFNPSGLTKTFKRRMKKFELPEIRFHDLRHSNGALMIACNVPMKGASDRLGHSTIVITNDFYGHVEDSVQRQIAETIDRAIWGEQK